MNKVLFLLLLIICIQSVSVSLAEEKRIALVIGNGAYRTSPLANPVNDAKDISGALKKCGFTVITALNVNRREMRERIRDFGTLSKRGGVGLFD